MTPPSDPSRLVVRDAGRGDIPGIVRMAADLARQQGDPATFFSHENAAEDIFGPRPWISAIVAEMAGAEAGMLLWYPAYETAYAARGGFVVSLWVDEPFRRRGVATALLAAAADRVRGVGGQYLWWTSQSGNRRAQATYASVGAGAEIVVAHALTGERFLALARRHAA